ncbi:MAG: pyridoxamine 5'-phosphate oxidase family protein [Actinobacteria bacterium]|nr:pyridoxamine 5'-phosphate oxidase family protein [Actinomycetota bacterium]
MARWSDLEAEARPLATLVAERFESTGLIMLGTLRRDGRPRISPCEFLVRDGRIELGMMWRSRKALDLLHDPRCILHSTTTATDGSQGDAKVSGRALPVDDAAERVRHSRAFEEKTGWGPTGDEWHLFAVDMEEVAFQRFGDERRVLVWRPGGPAVERTPPTE